MKIFGYHFAKLFRVVGRILANFFCSVRGAFLLGAIIGLAFFALEFGLNLANPTNANWIFYPVAHDTTQHFLGWEFFRESAAGARISALAAPVGLPLTFMDAIPILALPFKFFANFLPANFQYFGLWALSCYVLLGGISAILMRKIWVKIFAKNVRTSCETPQPRNSHDQRASDPNDKKSIREKLKIHVKLAQNFRENSRWQILFIAAGSAILVLNPITLARTLYHSALAAEWLILLAILLIWDAKKLAKIWHFATIWSIFLIVATLIHPYFLPMLGAMMLIAALRTLPNFSRANFAKLGVKIFVPVACAGATFFALGGFSLGGGAAEIYDLPDKGFNLISFAMSGGWSAAVPAISAHSGSPETMMWLGLGVWILTILVAIFGWKILRKIYQNSRKNSAKIGFTKWLWRQLFTKFSTHFSRNLAMLIVAFLLLIFAIGVSIEIGPLRIFQWRPPDFIWDFWNVFRAAAREAWPFYFAFILLIIFASGKIIKYFCENFSRKNSNKKTPVAPSAAKQSTNSRMDCHGDKSARGDAVLRFAKSAPKIFAIIIFIVAICQFCDIFFSPMATRKRAEFAKIQHANSRYFAAPNIDNLITTQKNLIVLDANFSGDQSGFYQLAQAALSHKLTLNLGYFARVPDEVFAQQKVWRAKVLAGQLTAQDFRENLFVTKDANLAQEISRKYAVEKRGDFYFIIPKN